MTASATASDDKMSRRDWIILVAWSTLLAGVYLAAAAIFAPKEYRNREASLARHRDRFDPRAPEVGVDAADLAHTPGPDARVVHVGLHLDRIAELSIRDTSWTADFQIWFRWTAKDFDPGEQFQVVDGRIESMEKEFERHAGEEHYERFRVVAKITKLFDISRFPCDDHQLTINVFFPRYPRATLRLEPDRDASDVSQRSRIPAYQIYQTAVTEKPLVFATPLGDPLHAKDERTIYSQFKFGIWIGRSGWGYFFKVFQSLYIAVAIAMLALFIKPTNVDPRFGLGVGGLFAAVANNYISNELIPDTGVLTLTDIVNFIGIATIFVTILESTISLYFFERRGKELLSRRLDAVSFVVILAGYALVNIALPLAAMTR